MGKGSDVIYDPDSYLVISVDGGQKVTSAVVKDSSFPTYENEQYEL